MARSCLNKIPSSFLTTCDLPIHGVKNIYLMHTGDVTVTLATDAAISSAVFAKNARAYRVEGYKQNIQITAAARTLDASNKLDVSVMFKIRPNAFAGLNSILTGRFYVLVVYNDGSLPSQFLGYASPLECSAIDYDSNANGMYVTVTLTAPDGSAGNYLTPASNTVRDAIISKA